LVLLKFVTNPVFSAASLSCVGTHSVAVTDCKSINTSSAILLYTVRSVTNHSIRISLNIPYCFLQYYIKQYCGQCTV